GQGRESQRSRGQRAPLTLTALDLGGDGPCHQAAAGDRPRRPHAGRGVARGASGSPSLGARLCSTVYDELVQGVHDRATHALWALGRAGAWPSHRSRAEAALDAAAPAALCAGGEDGAAPARAFCNAPSAVARCPPSISRNILTISLPAKSGGTCANWNA